VTSPKQTPPPEKPWFPKHYADTVQRLRVPAGIVLALAVILLSEPTWTSLAVSLPFAFIGLGLRAWAAGHLAKNEDLAVSGPYGMLRNPLYLGTLLAAVALAIASTRLLVFLLVLAVFVLVYFPVIEQEEAHLRKLFPSFARYARRVPMLTPIWPPAGPLGGFRGSLYLRNEEYKALGALTLAFAYLVWRVW
jgi:protein-S-isoprenylcysteine O-methyltransferase Ste14